jgi:hypothetical protein
MGASVTMARKSGAVRGQRRAAPVSRDSMRNGWDDR